MSEPWVPSTPVLLSRSKVADAIVTVCTPVVFRPEQAMKTLTSLKKNADFPSIFRVLIHPYHEKLIKWAINQGFEVWKGFKRPLVAARYWLVNGLKTEYCLINYCDWEPVTDFMPLLNAMKEDATLASISPILETHGAFRYGSILNISKDSACRIPLRKSVAEKINPGKPFYYVGYTTNSSILIRMKAFRQFPFDTRYEVMGHHFDWFMHLHYTNWRSAIHRHVHVRRLASTNPAWYTKIRRSNISLDRQKFKEKWGKILV